MSTTDDTPFKLCHTFIREQTCKGALPRPPPVHTCAASRHSLFITIGYNRHLKALRNRTTNLI